REPIEAKAAIYPPKRQDAALLEAEGKAVELEHRGGRFLERGIVAHQGPSRSQLAGEIGDLIADVLRRSQLEANLDVIHAPGVGEHLSRLRRPHIGAGCNSLETDLSRQALGVAPKLRTTFGGQPASPISQLMLRGRLGVAHEQNHEHRRRTFSPALFVPAQLGGYDACANRSRGPCRSPSPQRWWCDLPNVRGVWRRTSARRSGGCYAGPPS